MDKQHLTQLLSAAVAHIRRERDGGLPKVRTIPNDRLEFLNEQVKRTLSLELSIRRLTKARDRSIDGELLSIPLQRLRTLNHGAEDVYASRITAQLQRCLLSLSHVFESPLRTAALLGCIALSVAILARIVPDKASRNTEDYVLQSVYSARKGSAFPEKFPSTLLDPQEITVLTAYQADASAAISLRSFLSDNRRYTVSPDDLRIRLDLPVQQLLIGQRSVGIP